MTKDLRPVFIAGCMRTGSTITRKILSEHPDVSAIEAELRFLTDPDGAFDFVRALTSEGWTQNRGDRAVARFRDLLYRMHSNHKEKPYHLHEFDQWFHPKYYKWALKMLDTFVAYEERNSVVFGSKGGASPEYFLTNPTPAWIVRDHIKQFVNALYYHRAPYATHFVEDTPENLLHYQDLRKMFGADMRFIHVYRDPRDVVSSWYGWDAPRSNSMQGGSDPVQTAWRIRDMLEEWWRVRDFEIPPEEGTFLEVKFEDLVYHHEQTLREICAHLDLPWTDALLDSRFDPSRAHVGRRKKNLEQDEIENINEILKPALEEYGYV